MTISSGADGKEYPLLYARRGISPDDLAARYDRAWEVARKAAALLRVHMAQRKSPFLALWPTASGFPGGPISTWLRGASRMIAFTRL